MSTFRGGIVAVLAGAMTAGAAWAAAGRDAEKPLLAGPAGGRVYWRSYKPLSRPYRPWKLDWENYIHKDFFPCINDFTVASAGEGGRPPGMAVDCGGRPYGAAVQAAQIVWLRFFDVTKEQARQGALRTRPREYCPVSDWRGYELLRWDVKFTKDAHVWWAIEDKAVYPPVVGNYDVKAGTWTTLEIDLEQAASQRGLDLAQMWMMWARCSMEAGEYAWKNLRLARSSTLRPRPEGRGAKAEHPVLGDGNATKLPPHPARRGPPVPDEPPDPAPLPAPRTIVFRSDTDIGMDFRGNTKAAHVIAYDARRLLLVLVDDDPRFGWRDNAGKELPGVRRAEVFAVQTLDGGKTWTGLAGDKGRSYMYTYMKPLTQAIDSGGNAILWNENGCDNNPGPRRRLTRLTFLGKKGWTYNRKDYVFDCEAFHCGFQKRFEDTVRVPSGRIWAIVHTEHRLIDPASAMYAKYSDDDGASWHSWQEGRIAMVPGSGDCTNAYAVPFGEHVAVLWRSERTAREDPLHFYWSHFDGNRWSAPQVVHGAYLRSAAAVGPKQFIVAVGGYWGKLTTLPAGPKEGVKRFDGAGWVRELTGPLPGTFCVSGGSVAAVSLKHDKKGFEVRWRSPAGQWDPAPRTIDTGPVKCFALPRFAPATFVPVLYMNESDRKEVKILLAPNPHAAP